MATKQQETTTPKSKHVPIRRTKQKARTKAAPRAVQQVLSVALIRKDLGINRKVFARLTGYSERAVAKWEAGEKLSGASLQKMTEMRRLREALATVMKAEFVPQWLQEPNDSFGGLKPLEVVERGEIDRIWHMVFELESGMPG